MGRPRCPIFAVTRFEQSARQCYLYRNIHPLLYSDDVAEQWDKDIERRIKFAFKSGLDRGFIKNGSLCVVVTGWAQGRQGTTNTMRLMTVQAYIIPPIWWRQKFSRRFKFRNPSAVREKFLSDNCAK